MARAISRMIKTPRIVQKFYVYDPNVRDELGGLRVHSEKDDKGHVKDGTRHVLAVTQQVQYWLDQGMLGEKPLSEISGSVKKLLAQVTRGRSVDNDADPKRVAKYDRKAQSGSPIFAGQPLHRRAKKKPAKKNGNHKSETKRQPSSPAS